MFEVVAGATPGQLRPATRQACINGAIQILGRELRHMPAVLGEMSGVQRSLLKLHLCQAIAAIGTAENSEYLALRDATKISLEPARRGSGIPPTISADDASRS